MSSRRHGGRRPGAAKSTPPKPVWLWTVSALVAGAIGLYYSSHSSAPTSSRELPSSKTPVVDYYKLEPEKAAFARYGGSASCKDCHQEAYELWQTSNHALAERPVEAGRDARAFAPPRSFKHGSQTTEVRVAEGRFEVVADGLTNRAPFQVDRVIGNHPLLQYLTPFPGGRWQTLEASYDPVSNQWFNVYGEEDRKPGEWGHWTGRGMNWNTMCAACHNTRLRKNYDEETDTFRTTMVEMGVGCESCHGPMKDHNEWQYKNKGQNKTDPTIRKLTREQTLHNCAFCHSRRMDLTGDFKPGDNYYDHQSLQIVDESDIFYPDGQVRDEDYEFTSFLGSRMHAAGGILCSDCHNPHSMKTLLPGNLLCSRCHEGGHTNAPIIDPVKHSFHKVFNPFVDTNGQPVEVDLTTTDFKNIKETGGQCVNCHMPQTAYMQRHWRHDHGWTVPDPLLTKQFGIPNACNRCHTDPTNTVDWAIGYVDKWYGAKMERPSRKRAQTAALARRGDAVARAPLLDQLGKDAYPYWRAVAANLLENWAREPEVTAALLRQFSDTNALVRANVAQTLAGLLEEQPPPGVEAALRKALEDPIRAVRYHAAVGLRAAVDPASPVGREFLHVLQVNADQPAGQMQKGVYALARQNVRQAQAHFEKAAKWDPYSPGIRHELAVVLSQQGQNQAALLQMREAVRLAPKDAEFRYKLGLSLNDSGDLPGCVAQLEEAVQLDPAHGRAWYNLGLARNELQKPEGALAALGRAELLVPNDPRIPYAAGTILVKQGRNSDARAAARRALAINPNYQEARNLLRVVEPGQ